jgi:hypothetical protein
VTVARFAIRKESAYDSKKPPAIVDFFGRSIVAVSPPKAMSLQSHVQITLRSDAGDTLVGLHRQCGSDRERHTSPGTRSAGRAICVVDVFQAGSLPPTVAGPRRPRALPRGPTRRRASGRAFSHQEAAYSPAPPSSKAASTALENATLRSQRGSCLTTTD